MLSDCSAADVILSSCLSCVSDPGACRAADCGSFEGELAARSWTIQPAPRKVSQCCKLRSRRKAARFADSRRHRLHPPLRPQPRVCAGFVVDWLSRMSHVSFFFVLGRVRWSHDSFFLLATCVPDPVARCVINYFRLPSRLCFLREPDPLKAYLTCLFPDRLRVILQCFSHFLSLSALLLFYCFVCCPLPVGIHFVDAEYNLSLGLLILAPSCALYRAHPATSHSRVRLLSLSLALMRGSLSLATCPSRSLSCTLACTLSLVVSRLSRALSCLLVPSRAFSCLLVPSRLSLASPRASPSSKVTRISEFLFE